MSNDSIKLLAKTGIAAFLLMCFVYFAVNQASAATWEPIKQCWERPIEKENGTPLALEEIAAYEMWYNEDDHGLNWELAWTVTNDVNCITYTPQGTGGEVCFNGFVVPTYGGEKSKVSETVCHMPVEVAPSAPKPLRFLM